MKKSILYLLMPVILSVFGNQFNIYGQYRNTTDPRFFKSKIHGGLSTYVFFTSIKSTRLGWFIGTEFGENAFFSYIGFYPTKTVDGYTFTKTDLNSFATKNINVSRESRLMVFTLGVRKHLMDKKSTLQVYPIFGTGMLVYNFITKYENPNDVVLNPKECPQGRQYGFEAQLFQLIPGAGISKEISIFYLFSELNFIIPIYRISDLGSSTGTWGFGNSENYLLGTAMDFRVGARVRLYKK